MPFPPSDINLVFLLKKHLKRDLNLVVTYDYVALIFTSLCMSNYKYHLIYKEQLVHTPGTKCSGSLHPNIEHMVS